MQNCGPESLLSLPREKVTTLRLSAPELMETILQSTWATWEPPLTFRVNANQEYNMEFVANTFKEHPSIGKSYTVQLRLGKKWVGASLKDAAKCKTWLHYIEHSDNNSPLFELISSKWKTFYESHLETLRHAKVNVAKAQREINCMIAEDSEKYQKMYKTETDMVALIGKDFIVHAERMAMGREDTMLLSKVLTCEEEIERMEKEDERRLLMENEMRAMAKEDERMEGTDLSDDSMESKGESSRKGSETDLQVVKVSSEENSKENSLKAKSEAKSESKTGATSEAKDEENTEAKSKARSGEKNEAKEQEQKEKKE